VLDLKVFIRTTVKVSHQCLEAEERSHQNPHVSHKYIAVDYSSVNQYCVSTSMPYCDRVSQQASLANLPTST
jgi:hypothetical protein